MRVKAIAAEDGTSASAVVREAVRVYVETRTTSAGGGVCAACRSWGEHVAAALSPADGAGS